MKPQPTTVLPRLMIVWETLPHASTGATILLLRLFQTYPQDKLWALTTRRIVALPPGDCVPDASHCAAVLDFRLSRRVIFHLAVMLNWLLVPQIVSRGVRFARAKNIQAIFAVQWGPYCLAAYFIHRVTGLPLYIYMMDDPEGKWHRNFLRAPLYSFFIPRIMRAARRIWGVSDGMCENLETRFGVHCLLLPPLVDVADFKKKIASSGSSNRGTLKIVYTGSVYGAQLDSVQRLLRIVNNESSYAQDRTELEVTLYTTASESYLGKIGVCLGKNVRRAEVKLDEIPRVLAEADIAFLPLSFVPEMRHIVETSFPSKISEYLASGVPILVHAPPSSSVSRYCREHSCGLVVDEPSDTKLRQALTRLADDAILRANLSENALVTAHANHDVCTIVPNFFADICSQAQPVL